MTYTYGDGICCQYFRDVVRESVDVVGDSNGPTEFGYNEVTEFGHLSSQSVDLVSDDEYHLVMLDSVGDAMCCGYADGSAVLFCDQDGSVHSRTV
jgi:hypothetical protein